MQHLQFLITNDIGLHARPASIFTREACRFESEILVRNLSTASDPVDAKSILGVLSLGVKQGHKIEVAFDGIDETEASETLAKLITSGFENHRV